MGAEPGEVLSVLAGGVAWVAAGSSWVWFAALAGSWIRPMTSLGFLLYLIMILPRECSVLFCSVPFCSVLFCFVESNGKLSWNHIHMIHIIWNAKFPNKTFAYINILCFKRNGWSWSSYFYCKCIFLLKQSHSKVISMIMIIFWLLMFLLFLHIFVLYLAINLYEFNKICSYQTGNRASHLKRQGIFLGPLLLTWLNFHPSMDK